MKIAIVDNYDSFTYNLVHYIENITGELPHVFRNDLLDLNDLDTFDCLVLSPGPGLPQNAGRLMEIIDTFWQKKALFGVCLGHQALGVYFGGRLKNLSHVFHGESMPMHIKQTTTLYQSLQNPVWVGRYHSWVVDASTMSDDCLITAIDDEHEVMSFEHKTFPIVGIQYHPESILTPNGLLILTNYFNGLKKE